MALIFRFDFHSPPLPVSLDLTRGLWKAVKKREEQAREALEEARAKEAHAVILKEGGVIDGARRSADRGGAKGVVLQF